MFDKLLMAAAQPVAATDGDEHIANTELLLKGEGSNGQTNNTFVDSSASSHTITRNGDTTQGSFSPFSPKGWSGYSPNGINYWEVSHSTGLQLVNTDFTLEAWIYLTEYPNNNNGNYISHILSKDSNAGNNTREWTWRLTGTSTSYTNLQFFYFRNSNPYFNTYDSSFNFQLNTWYHIRTTKSGTNLYHFVNGTLIGTHTSIPQDTVAYTNNLRVGHNWNTSSNVATFKGYISNLRLIKGSALSTSDFTVPTEPLTAVTNTTLLAFQDNRLIDNSSSNHTITATGDVAIKPTSPFSGDRTYPKASYFSGKFDGSNDYLDCGSNSDFAFGTGDFTVEGWFNATDLSSGAGLVYIGGNASSYAGVRVGISSNQLYLLMSTTGTSWQIQTGLIGNTISTGSWYHFAVTRNSTTVRVFLNGTQIASPSLSGSLYFGTQNRFGYSNTEYLNGYLSNLRIVKGTCLYTTTFTPPTAPLTPVANTKLLTLQDNYLVDHSPSGHSITNNGGVTLEPESPFSNSTYPLSGTFYSGYFDGTNDNLTIPDNSAFDLSSGDFTVEGWIKPLSNSDTMYFGQWLGWGWFFGVSQGTLQFASYDGSYHLENSGVAPSTYYNKWTHIAATREGNTLRIFVNGEKKGGDHTLSHTFTNSSGNFEIGSNGGAQYYNGYISNVRIVKGTALYTSDFTVPSEPLTAVSGTTLLTLQDATIQDNSASGHSITNNGVTVTEIAPFGAALIDRAGSMYFDGSGDYIQSSYSSEFTFGTGDFTIECWIYREQPSSSLYTSLAGIWSGASNTPQAWYWYIDPSNELRFINNHPSTGADDQIFSSPATVGLNQWYHIAVTRNGNVWRTFVNGTQEAINSNYSTGMAAGSNPLLIGYVSSPTANDIPFKGFISDFRITKGTALYTSNFTPPTAPLQPITNTKLLLSGNNGGVEDSLGKANCETNGNMSIDTSVKKFGVGSFEGGQSNGDYLLFPADPKWNLSSGVFTIEGWVYPKSNSGNIGIVMYSGTTCAFNTTTGISYNFYIQSTGALRFNAYTSGSSNSSLTSNSNAITYNAWNYVAVVGNGSNYSLYINGTRVDTNTTAKPNMPSSIAGLSVGGFGKASGCSSTGNAYYDDLRITNGVARYDPTQTSHTVPTKTHPTI